MVNLKVFVGKSENLLGPFTDSVALLGELIIVSKLALYAIRQRVDDKPSRDCQSRLRLLEFALEEVWDESELMITVTRERSFMLRPGNL